MGMLRLMNRVNEFTIQLASSLNDDVQTFKQNAKRAVAAGSQAIPALENDVIFRCLMLDYWANVATLPSDAFPEYVPGSSNHQMIKQSNQQLSMVIMDILHKVSAVPQFERSLEGVLESGADEVTLKIAPLLAAKFSFSSSDYRDFLVFESGCWIFKNVAIQQMVGSRFQGPNHGPWTFEEVTQVSQWVETKVIPLFYDLKKTKGWDEIEIRIVRK